MKINLKKYGPWAVVTGASDGIGEAMARDLAAQGIHLVLVARRKEKLQLLASELTQKHQIQAQVIVADLSLPEGIQALIGETQTLDVGLLVSAAGFGTSGLFLESDLEAEKSMLEVNCGASLALSHFFSKRLVARKKGGIILFSSLVAFQGVPKAAHYAATKAYIQTFGEALHVELKSHGVDVLVTAPGPVLSGFGARADMKMSFGSHPSTVSRATLSALGKKTTVRPGFLSKFLEFSLKTTFSRWGRTQIFRIIMGGMTEHQKPKAAILSLLMAAAMSLAVSPQSHATENPVFGVWTNEAGTGNIRISLAPDGTLEGVGAPGAGDPDRKDAQNPDTLLKNRPLLGAKILWGFKPDNEEKTEWASGSIYDPDNGKTYSCKLNLEGEKLRIRGYVGIPLFGRTTVWTKKE